MSMQEDIGYIKGTLKGIGKSLQNIDVFIEKTHNHRQECSANFAATDTQIINIEKDVKENKGCIKKLKAKKDVMIVGKWAAWATILAALITGVFIILVKLI